MKNISICLIVFCKDPLKYQTFKNNIFAILLFFYLFHHLYYLYIYSYSAFGSISRTFSFHLRINFIELHRILCIFLTLHLLSFPFLINFAMLSVALNHFLHESILILILIIVEWI